MVEVEAGGHSVRRFTAGRDRKRPDALPPPVYGVPVGQPIAPPAWAVRLPGAKRSSSVHLRAAAWDRHASLGDAPADDPEFQQAMLMARHAAEILAAQQIGHTVRVPTGGELDAELAALRFEAEAARGSPTSGLVEDAVRGAYRAPPSPPPKVLKHMPPPPPRLAAAPLRVGGSPSSDDPFDDDIHSPNETAASHATISPPTTSGQTAFLAPTTPSPSSAGATPSSSRRSSRVEPADDGDRSARRASQLWLQQQCEAAEAADDWGAEWEEDVLRELSAASQPHVVSRRSSWATRSLPRVLRATAGETGARAAHADEPTRRARTIRRHLSVGPSSWTRGAPRAPAHPQEPLPAPHGRGQLLTVAPRRPAGSRQPHASWSRTSEAGGDLLCAGMMITDTGTTGDPPPPPPRRSRPAAYGSAAPSTADEVELAMLQDLLMPCPAGLPPPPPPRKRRLGSSDTKIWL
jgi:hypothetical protein